MIITRLRGGLGNQLFQYAAGRALADHHGTELMLDLYTYTKHPYRKYELFKFMTTAQEAGRAEVHRFTGSNPVVRYLNKRENYFRCPKVFAQPHYHYYEDFFSLPNDLYLSGYWQSEKFFAAAASQIRKEFILREPLDERNATLQRKMKGENSVSLHVRRGDYSSSNYTSFFGVVAKEYYDRAIEKIKSETNNPQFYIFSDDPVWCKEAFAGAKLELIEHNHGDDAHKDFVLMSSCRHNIIANSSFSWWAAWLNANEGKRVIAPQQWFKENYLLKKEAVYASRFYNTKDLIPESWTRL